MSHIDEAFIQAYANPQQPADVPGAGEVPVVPSQLPLAGLHGGPHIRLQPTQPPASPTPKTPEPVATTTPTTAPAPAATPAPPAWTPEPMPTSNIQPPVDSQPTTSAHETTRVDAVEVTEPPVATPVERRPLSTFATPEPLPTTAFNPVYEVDAFRWPSMTNQLLSAHHELLIPVADHLLDIAEQGRSLVGIAGMRANVGCSTLLTCLARMLSSVGKSVALVDANFAKASLARDLGLEFDVGWEAALTGDLPLAECVINSLDDNMVLLPLCRQNAHAHELLASIQTSVSAGVLRYHYDVVLFNLGAAGMSPQCTTAQSVMQHCRLDANIVVADIERTSGESLEPLLSLFGNTCLGVIGNSAP